MIKLFAILTAVFVSYLFGGPLTRAAYASDLKTDEEVLFFTTPAVMDQTEQQWHATVHGWIFERENDSIWRDALTLSIVASLGFDEGALQETLFRERLRMFLVDNERDKQLTVQVNGTTVVTEKSGANGHFYAPLTIAVSPGAGANSWLPVRLIAQEGDQRRVTGRLQLVAAKGISVVSDIDDTVKQSNVLDKKELLQNTFARPFAAVPGMPEAYQAWASQGAVFHYVSSSPWQLYPALIQFLHDSGLPDGSLFLKNFRIKDESFFDLFASPLASKLPAISGLVERYPHRQFILVGDSGEKDPEVYAAIYRQYKNRIRHIFIRNVTAENAQARRYQDAFAGIADDKWTVFEDAGELQRYRLNKP
jgi:phosphatidate phosphatase APP1